MSQISFAHERPNIIFILADDLGYGDVSCYNEQSKVQTPHLDKLAAQGIRFTHGHSPSTVCTPTRYSLMTGRMPFRLNYRGVFTGAGGPCLIDENRLTVASMLKQQGYSTAMFGKWHIGMTFYDKDGKAIHQNGLEAAKRVDFTRQIKGTPIDYGFDQFFGTVSCPTTDFIYAYIDSNRFPTKPTGMLDKSTLPSHNLSGLRDGLHAPDFDLEEVDNVFLEKSLNYIDSQKGSDRPFFLFHSAQAVHLPALPANKYKGKTNVGPQGDFIFQFDDHVGQIISCLKRNNLHENTLVIVSSDNGPEAWTTKVLRKEFDHDSAAPWRGVKRDNWEGGHRVPFIVSWPAKIKTGFTSPEKVSIVDFMATAADITGFQLPNESAEDSFSFLPVINGSKMKRPFLLHQTISMELGIQKGKWKYLDHKGSGGNPYKMDAKRRNSMGEYALPNNAPNAPGQLYNLEVDPGETNNLYNEHPKVVKELKSLLDKAKKDGRTR